MQPVQLEKAISNPDLRAGKVRQRSVASAENTEVARECWARWPRLLVVMWQPQVRASLETGDNLVITNVFRYLADVQ